MNGEESTLQRPKKIIVAGSREYTNKAVVFGALEYYLAGQQVEIVSGGARGVDQLGEDYARYKGLPCKTFPYRSEYGKAGGPIRNGEMARYADGLLAFWDGNSTGTKNMIDQAKARGLNVKVVRIDQENNFENLWYMIDKLNLENE